MSRVTSARILSLMTIASLATVMGSAANADPSEQDRDDWPMYGRNLHHTFTRHVSPIDKSNVASLTPAWTFRPGDAVTASPAVVDGVVYIGSWDGYFYALDQHTGAVRWKFQVDCQNSIVPIPPQCLAPGQTPPDRGGTSGGLITSSAAVINGRIYFGGGKTMYCLRATDGALLWKHAVCGNPDQPNCQNDLNDPTQIFSSPAVFEDKIIFGHTVNGTTGYRGAIKALEASTGRLVWNFEIDPIIDAQGNPVLNKNGNAAGAYNRGCGSVWGSGAVDEVNRLVFFGTGDCQGDSTPPYHEAVLALHAGSGKVKWAFRPRKTDACDFDFGASANVLEIDGNRYAGIGGKDGTYYVLRSDTDNPAGQLLWSTNVVFGGSSGGFIGSTAFDGKRLYGGTGYGELGGPVCDPTNPRDTQVQDPSYHALDVNGGKVVWEGSGHYSFAASSVVNDVVFNGWAGFGPPSPASFTAYDSSNGTVLADFPMDGSVNSSAAIVGRMVFFGTGNSYDGAGSSVRAYKLRLALDPWPLLALSPTLGLAPKGGESGP